MTKETEAFPPLPVTTLSREAYAALSSAIDKHGTPFGPELTLLQATPENLALVLEEMRRASAGQ